MPRALVRSGAIGVLCGMVLAAAPAAASAKGPFDTPHRSLSVTMKLHGSRGYRVEIESTPNRQVLLQASRGDVWATYTVPGRVTHRGLHANLGRFGRVSVRFRRIGKAKVGGPPFGLLKCKGRNPIREHGRFEGTIRFHGEQGFTNVSVRGANGSVVRRFRRRCHLPTHKRPARARAAARSRNSFLASALIAEDKSRNREVSFRILSTEAEPRKGKRKLFLSFVSAITSEQRGRMTIGRWALVDGDPGSLLLSPFGVQPIEATVNPPRPFAGTGSYLEEAGLEPSWTGSLRVRLPGAEVPLTGPGFTATLCRERNLDKFDKCADAAEGEAARSLIAGFQGSGSHSQPFAEARLSRSR